MSTKDQGTVPGGRDWRYDNYVQRVILDWIFFFFFFLARKDIIGTTCEACVGVGRGQCSRPGFGGGLAACRRMPSFAGNTP